MKRICPKCLTRWYSADTSDNVWICEKCGAEIPKSEETVTESENIVNLQFTKGMEI